MSECDVAGGLVDGEARRWEILVSLAGALREVMDDGGLMSDKISYETSFSRDLELESIEFVALAEQLQVLYGDQVDFVAWLSQRTLDELIEITVGTVVDYIAACR